MRLLSLVLLAACCTATGPAAAAPAVVALGLREEAVAERTTYALGDVATVESADAALRDALRALPIGRAPRVGQAGDVTRGEVEARIARRWPHLRERLRWHGAVRTLVRAAGRSVPVALDAARAALAMRLAACCAEWSAEPGEPDARVTLPSGRIDVAARVAGAGALRARTRVLLDYAVDGAHYATVPVWFEVAARGPAWVAARDLAAGAPIGDEDFALEVVDLARLGGAALASDAPPAGLRLRRALSRGEALAADAVEPMPAVAKGDVLTVTARAGRVVVAALATALEDGRVGERIRVERAGGGDPFPVRVTGRGLADATGGPG